MSGASCGRWIIYNVPENRFRVFGAGYQREYNFFSVEETWCVREMSSRPTRRTGTKFLLISQIVGAAKPFDKVTLLRANLVMKFYLFAICSVTRKSSSPN